MPFIRNIREKENILDINISWEKGTFTTNVNRKPTFIEVYTHLIDFYLIPAKLA